MGKKAAGAADLAAAEACCPGSLAQPLGRVSDRALRPRVVGVRVPPGAGAEVQAGVDLAEEAISAAEGQGETGSPILDLRFWIADLREISYAASICSLRG